MFGSILMGTNEPQTSITFASQYDHQILVFCWYSDTPMESQSREIRCYGVYIEPTGKTVNHYIRLRVQTLPQAEFVEPEGSHPIFKVLHKKRPKGASFVWMAEKEGLLKTGSCLF